MALSRSINERTVVQAYCVSSPSGYCWMDPKQKALCYVISKLYSLQIVLRSRYCLQMLLPLHSDQISFTTLLLIFHLALRTSLMRVLLLSNQLDATDCFLGTLIAVNVITKFPDFYSLPCSQAVATVLS